MLGAAMIDKDYRIALSFLQVEPENFSFHVYRTARKDVTETRPNEHIFGYNLPESPNAESRAEYWVSLTDRTGYERTQVDSDSNRYLTLQFLYHALSSACV